MTLEMSVPVLGVADVAASLRWYAAAFGFEGDPFPQSPPHTFAILRAGRAELMLRRAAGGVARASREFEWDFYLRVEGASILDAAARAGGVTPLLRGPERMPYGLVEFELLDPDGHRIAVGGEAPPGAAVAPRTD